VNPLVSVVIPVYNCERYIKQSINSILAQTYPNIECIVSNDGSTDRTREFLTSYGSLIKIIDAENKGESTAVNRGFERANGEYVIVLCADDLLAINSVSKLVEFMEYHPKVVVGYPDFDIINENGTIIEHKKTREYDYRYMISHHWCFPSVGSIIRYKVLEHSGPRDLSYKYVGDLEHFMRIGKYGDMLHIPENLAYWRRWGGQISYERGRAMANEHLRLVVDYYKEQSLPQSILKKKNQAYCWAYIVAGLKTSGAYRIIYLLTALGYYPQEALNIKNYWRLLNINKFSKGGTQNG
jgi:glycosyltransferase involved in cell wall biosynthesis